MRKRLTDRLIEGLQPKSKRYLVYDSIVPHLAVRVSHRKTFVLVARFNSKHPTRRSIGPCVRLSIEQAREAARDWHRQLSRGKDPARPTTSFGTIAEAFFVHIRKQRQSHEVERKVRREFVSRWRDRPIASITRADMLEVIDEVVARGAPYAAHNLFAYIRRIFNWAIARGVLEHSPCDRVKPKDIIGPRQPRQRVLTDDELRALWAASARVGTFGVFCRLMLLTGTRRGEAAGARWPEFDNGLWTIPPERFKSNATHLVPLSSLARDLIHQLPDTGGGLIFGHRLRGFSKMKKRLDKHMGIAPWRLHDIRRTVRTRLSSLRVSQEVAEMVIGHGKKGLARVYDQHEYIDEMREALETWATHLSGIVGIRNGNVPCNPREDIHTPPVINAQEDDHDSSSHREVPETRPTQSA